MIIKAIKKMYIPRVGVFRPWEEMNTDKELWIQLINDGFAISKDEEIKTETTEESSQDESEKDSYSFDKMKKDELIKKANEMWLVFWKEWKDVKKNEIVQEIERNLDIK